MSRKILLEGDTLTLEQVSLVSAGGARVELARVAVERMRASRAAVDAALASGLPVYGVNTGFGQLADVRIPDGKVRELQYNLLRSHAAGVGEPLGPAETRAAMLLRANALARGCSGIRPRVVEHLLDLLNADILPRVPSQGSVGASGDLAPLAHLALPLIGEGQVLRGGRFVSASSALRAAGLRPIELEAKEGLSLINGTQIMTALGALALLECERLLVHCDLAGAMSTEALKGSVRPFDARIQRVRPHPGQIASARNLRRLLARSEIGSSHRDCGKVQDSYSLRCMPQVHGTGRAAAAHARQVLEIEINAATDNPLVFAGAAEAASTAGEGSRGRRASRKSEAQARGLSRRAELVSGGNFHGQPVSAVLDYLALAMTGVASMSERRTDRLVNPYFSELPAFLAEDVGLNSGFMLAQVTSAALVSECKTLSHPASVDSIPTSANKEDHVSMGPIAARKTAAIVANMRRVLAIEILVAAQGLDFLAPLRPARAVAAAHARIRRDVPRMKRDRMIAPDIEAVEQLIRSGEIRKAAEGEAGPLR